MYMYIVKPESLDETLRLLYIDLDSKKSWKCSVVASSPMVYLKREILRQPECMTRVLDDLKGKPSKLDF